MTEPLQIAICEDTAADQERLVELLGQCSIPSQSTLFSSGEALLEAYQPGRFDLLLSDIYMSGMSGVDAVTRLRAMDQELPVAFVTTSTDHALEGYRLSVLKYIEKPFCRQDLEEILALARMKQQSGPVLTLHASGRETRIRLSHIVYLEQQNHHVIIRLSDASALQISGKLSTLLSQIEGSDFFQPHKSYCVNLAFVEAIDPDLRCFVLQGGGEKIPIRRESMGKARQALKAYLFGRTRGGIS